MSSREDKTSETGKETGYKSLLFSLWKKMSTGKKGEKKHQPSEPQEESPQPPEEALPETPPVEELPFEQLPAPEELMEYYLLFCQGQGQEGNKSTIEDFCADSRPETAFLKQVISQIEGKAASVMKEYRKQTKLSIMKAEQRLRALSREQEGEDASPEASPEEAPAPALNGQVLVFCAPDWSAAWGIALPALGDGLPITRALVLTSLEERNITFGIDQEVVNRLATPQGALTLQKLAVSAPPIPGEDGKTIEYFPRTVGTPQIMENAQGIVDFDNLNWLTHIEEGTVICDIVQPTQGTSGTNIQGNPIRPYNGKKANLPKGDNVVPNADGTSLISKIDGQISFRDGKFHVNNTIVIQGNVDLSTGSIDVQGDVVIHGNVLAGFTVTASGNITIGGLVEGSQITAGGNVVVNRGMNGNVVGSITAGKDIVCKYMENATAHAMGEIHMDSIVNCDLAARGKVVVKTGRGVIIGGTVRSMGGIEAKTIGNIAGRLTILSIGPTPWFLEEKAQVEEQLEKLQQEMKRQPAGQGALLKMKEKPLKKSLEEMEFQEAAAAQKQIVASTLYPMAQVSINGITKHIASSQSPCRIYLDAKESAVKVINV